MRLNLIERWRAATPLAPKMKRRRKSASAGAMDEQKRVTAIAELAGKAGETIALDQLFSMPLDEASAELERRRLIREQVQTAATIAPTISPALADRFVIGGASPQEVGAALLNQIVDAQSPEIATHHQPGERTRAASGIWDDAITKGNARRAGERAGNDS